MTLKCKMSTRLAVSFYLCASLISTVYILLQTYIVTYDITLTLFQQTVTEFDTLISLDFNSPTDLTEHISCGSEFHIRGPATLKVLDWSVDEYVHHARNPKKALFGVSKRRDGMSQMITSWKYEGVTL